MTRRAVRLILFAALVSTFLAAAWQILRLDQQLDLRTRDAVSIAASLQQVRVGLLEARASERAILAPTQGVPFWRDRVAATLAVLDARISGLKEAPLTVNGRAAVDRLAAATAELGRVERRVIGHADAGRLSHAEDLIYADALHASLAVERELAGVEQVIGLEGMVAARAARKQQGVTALAAALTALCLVVVLMRRVGRAVASQEPDEAAAADLGAGTLGVSASTLPEAGELPLRAAPAPAIVPVRAPERAASPAALLAAAEICGALARVKDPRDLAGLVERLSTVLDAKGTIVWVCDDDRRRLRPALSYGYPSPVIGRMGTIALDGDTPAAHAFRLAEPRLVGGGPNEGASALIVPMVAPGGTAGVMTVELPPGNERQPATLALARIFAAQLAVLVGVPEPAATYAVAKSATSTPA